MSRDRSWIDGDKLSFSELDRRRKERPSSGEAPPRGSAAEARSQRANRQYLEHIDGMFSGGPGGEERDRLAKAMRDAHGTGGLAEACRAYREALGVPADPALLGLFLDSGACELVVQGLEGLLSAHQAGALQVGRGLRSQLEILSQEPDDAVAEAAEELLERL